MTNVCLIFRCVWWCSGAKRGRGRPAKLPPTKRSRGRPPKVPSFQHDRLKEWELSVTVSAGSVDLPEGTLERLQQFLVEKCLVGMFSLERGGVCAHLHAQGVVRIMCKNAVSVNSILTKWLGWNESKPSPGAKIMCRALVGKGIHTWHGLLGYCSKDHAEPHYQDVMHNVSADDIAIGVDEYLKHGAGPLKQRVVLDPARIFDKAMAFANMRMRGKLRPSLTCVLQQMMLTGKYYPSASWVVPSAGMGWDLDRANAAWKMMLLPRETTFQDVEFVFGRRTNRYFDKPIPEHGLSDCVPANEGNSNAVNAIGEAYFVDEPDL